MLPLNGYIALLNVIIFCVFILCFTVLRFLLIISVCGIASVIANIANSQINKGFFENYNKLKKINGSETEKGKII